MKEFIILFAGLCIGWGNLSAQSLAEQIKTKAENYFNNDVPDLLYDEERKHLGEKEGGDLYIRLKLFKNGKANINLTEKNDEVTFTSIIPLRTEKGRLTFEKRIDFHIIKDTFKTHKPFDAVWNVVVTTSITWDENDNAISKSTAKIDWLQKPCVTVDLKIVRATHCLDKEASKEMLKSMRSHLEELDKKIEKTF